MLVIGRAYRSRGGQLTPSTLSLLRCYIAYIMHAVHQPSLGLRYIGYTLIHSCIQYKFVSYDGHVRIIYIDINYLMFLYCTSFVQDKQMSIMTRYTQHQQTT